ncbi:serine/threonine-protein kinase/endoribonuclease ire-1-like isoform X2 [Daphnia pulicaria]|nr:serine/threonine-protein kinase/endoribonuclease ire-1-like isoform X2 [Daphnia pulicaria]XP_046633958.1 serine/threonine-protein kinase/endoribonuclease ire-1-like isoform X2 [Daphnia pulicaria]XP_046633959.1 serine/threonine-protein kinase/endoribonuclease ire-1-like isoform X2 [Daphnia pulicaria]
MLQYDRSKILGNGTFATVFWGTWNGEAVAVKRIEMHKLNKRFKDREEVAMRQMDHQNVLKLKEVQENMDFKLLVLELCIGTVRNYVNDVNDEKMFNQKMPNEVEALIQMTNGLAYIHSQHFVHRDIKPENVLISSSYVLKISDFGVSKPTQPTGSFSVTSGPQGTKTYFAPEYLRLEHQESEERKNIKADKSIDIFSLGCLFFTYIMRKGPYAHLFATPGMQFNSKENYDIDVTNNILKDKKFLEKNGLSKGHYAFKMIDGMTKAKSKDRWGLDEKKFGSNSQTVIETLKLEQRRQNGPKQTVV